MSKIETAFPLSPLQEGMLYHALRHPESRAYHGQCIAELVGPWDPRQLHDAWSRVAARHPSLRSFFAWEGRDRPLQVVRQHADPEWQIVDFSGDSESEQARRWEQLVATDLERPFDLSVAPLMRLTLAHLGGDRHRLLWSVHHAVADGWSAMVVLREVRATYDDLSRGRVGDRPPPPSFAIFIAWLQARDRGAAERYWRAQLHGLRDGSALPGARPGQIGPGRSVVRVLLDEDVSVRLPRVAALARVTPNTLALGAWALVLARYTDSPTDVCFGMTIAERPAEIPRVGESVGPYLNTVPVRVPVGVHALSVEAWLQDLHAAIGEAQDHSVGGIAEISRWADLDPGGNLVRSAVVYESFPTVDDDGRLEGDLRMTDPTVTVFSELPLALLVYPGARYELALEYATDRYEEADATRLVGAAARALEELTSEGRASVDDIDILDPTERATLIDSWCGSHLDAPEVRDVLDLFESCVESSPHDPAVQDEVSSLSYGELDAAASQLSQRIGELGVPPEGLLAIPAEPSVSSIVGVLAALKSGVGYTFFDATQPEARRAHVLEYAHAVLAPSDDVRWPRVLATDVRASVDPRPGAQTRNGPTTVEPIHDERIAYVVWTSGSTGEPKGVVIERNQLARSTCARIAWYESSPGSFLLLSSLAVDSAVAGLFWTLCTGGRLVLPPRRAEQDPSSLAELIEREVIRTTLLLPSLYLALLEETEPGDLARLEHVIVAGEACSPAVVAIHRTKLPNAALYNEYGPSEATVWATAARLVPSESTGPRTISIGSPVPFVRVYLLDPRGRLVPVGAAGEICLGGSTLARGYLGDTELTADRFRPDPFVEGGRLYRTGDRGCHRADGTIQFLGRVDDQIKIRGYRVEPAEVEQALELHPLIHEAAVSATPMAPSVVIESDVDSLVAALREYSRPDVDRFLNDVAEPA